MRTIASVFGIIISLGWIVVGAVAGTSVAIVVGVVLLLLSVSSITVPRMLNGAGISAKASPSPNELG